MQYLLMIDEDESVYGPDKDGAAMAELVAKHMALGPKLGAARLGGAGLGFLPYHAVRADLLRRLGRREESRSAYDAALALSPPPAERLWLERVRAGLD